MAPAPSMVGADCLSAGGHLPLCTEPSASVCLSAEPSTQRRAVNAAQGRRRSAGPSTQRRAVHAVLGRRRSPGKTVFFLSGEGMDSHKSQNLVTSQSDGNHQPPLMSLEWPRHSRGHCGALTRKGRRLGQRFRPACTSTSSTKPTGHQPSKLVVHSEPSLWPCAPRSVLSPVTTVLQLLPRG